MFHIYNRYVFVNGVAKIVFFFELYKKTRRKIIESPRLMMFVGVKQVFRCV